jgi:hypothetical protein
MVYWSDLYKELAQLIIDKLGQQPSPEILYIDLWHEQVNFLTEEHPFPTPAVFLEFNTLDVEDNGKKVQRLRTQVDLYLFYETFSDTYTNAIMQDDALSYLDLISKLNAIFHGTSGTNFFEMQKTGMKREDSGGAGNLYRLTFECDVHDYSAEKIYDDVDTADKELSIESTDSIPDPEGNNFKVEY